MSAPPSIPARVLSHFWLKCLGTPAIMIGFFVAYFAVLRHPLSPSVEIPFTAPDRWVGFQPFALIPYLSLWFYVCLPSALMTDRRELVGHGVGNIVLGASGLLVFVLWPTNIPPSTVDWSLYPSFEFIKAIDATGNACPSLHAAFAVFAGCWLARMLRRIAAPRAARVLNILWAVAILHSTVATHQHVAIDAVAGGLLGWLVARLNLRLVPEPPPCPADSR